MTTSSDRNDVADASAPGRRLTLLYVFALSTVAMLSLGAQWLIQRQLSSGEGDSRVINLAGRQRMLSQRIAKASLQLEHPSELPAVDPRAELKTAVDLWSQSHEGLQRGDASLGLPGDNSDEVRRLFAVIEPHYLAMRTAAADALACEQGDARGAEAIATVQLHEGEFLKGMDAIVSQYVVEAETKVARLQRLEWVLLGLTLTVLLLEGMLIFRPAVRRIERTVGRLTAMGERLTLAKDEAERANAAKTRFLANVSHELRTPLTAVLGMTDLARSTEDDQKREDYLAVVEEAGESLRALLNDLIDLAKIDAEKIEIEDRVFDPQAVVHRVARIMQVAAAEKGLELVVNAGHDSTLSIRGDDRRIEQVLSNLVANAIKSTSAGRVTIGCTASPAGSDRARLSFSVYDTGPGIEPADQQRIFEPFTQLSNQKSKAQGGAGLGLAICQRIAAAIGAKITLLSTPGIGTTMTLSGEFPIAQPEPTADEQLAPEPTAASTRVLVVEDTEVNQILLRDILESAGHEVTIVHSGEAAVEATLREAFPLTIIDFYLPGMDGLATAHRLRGVAASAAREPSALVCLTAQAYDEQQSNELSDAFDAVAQKPIRRADLLRLVARHTGSEVSESVAADAPAEVAFETEMADAFLGVFDGQRRELVAAVDRRAFVDVKRLAHRFRSQVGYFEAAACERRLRELEAAADRQDSESLDACFTAASNELEQLVARLRSGAPVDVTPAVTS